MSKKYFCIDYFIILVLFFFGFLNNHCANQKITKSQRVYHQLNAKYNAHYHANELFNNLQKDLAKEPEPSYQDRLPLQKINNYTAQKYQAVYDSVIKKSYQAIELHQLNKNNKEWIPIVPELWLLLGKSHLQQLKFEQAREIFERTFRMSEQICIQIEAALGIAETYLWTRQNNQASPVLFQVKKILTEYNNENQKIPCKNEKKLTSTYEILQMEYFYQQKKISEALEHLEKAITLTSEKLTKSRYYFMAGQMAWEVKNQELALYYYNQVIRLNVQYDERLQAYLQKALLQATSEENSENNQDIEKKLLKYAKYKTNKPHLSRIYFTLSELEKKWNHPEKSKEYLTLATILVAEEGGNPGSIYFTFAQTSFVEKNYLQAQEYYQKSLPFLAPNTENYVIATTRAKALSSISQNLRELNNTDSLIFISQKSPAEQEEWLKNRKEPQNISQEININKNKKLNYFSPLLLSKGVDEFIKIWGDRPLNDHWRRNVNPLFENSDTVVLQIKNEKKIQFLNNDEDFKQANTEQMKRLYVLGVELKEYIKDTNSSLFYFEELGRRYPENPYRFSVAYQLYRIYENQKSDESVKKSEFYKDILKHCNCPEEQFLVENTTIDEKQQEILEQEFQKMYDLAFTSFQAGEFTQALLHCDNGLDFFLQKKYQIYFQKLKAECLKELGRVQEWRALEREIVINFSENN